MCFGGGTAISEDMFQWIQRDFNTIADDLAETLELADFHWLIS